MSLIKPLSDLRNTNEISKLALEIEVFGKLAVAQAQRADGDRGRTVSEAMKRLRKRIRSDMRDEPVRLEEVEMTDLARDPIVNGIYNGIRRGVEVAVANECYGSAVVLIYSGIDSMAYLAMPVNRIDVRRKDFIDWAERYIRFPCKEQLTGADLYGARCAMLHTYSVYSKMSREGKCRIIRVYG